MQAHSRVIIFYVQKMVWSGLEHENRLRLRIVYDNILVRHSQRCRQMPKRSVVAPKDIPFGYIMPSSLHAKPYTVDVLLRRRQDHVDKADVETSFPCPPHDVECMLAAQSSFEAEVGPRCDSLIDFFDSHATGPNLSGAFLKFLGELFGDVISVDEHPGWGKLSVDRRLTRPIWPCQYRAFWQDEALKFLVDLNDQLATASSCDFRRRF